MVSGHHNKNDREENTHIFHDCVLHIVHWPLFIDGHRIVSRSERSHNPGCSIVGGRSGRYKKQICLVTANFARHFDSWLESNCKSAKHEILPWNILQSIKLTNNLGHNKDQWYALANYYSVGCPLIMHFPLPRINVLIILRFFPSFGCWSSCLLWPFIAPSSIVQDMQMSCYWRSNRGMIKRRTFIGEKLHETIEVGIARQSNYFSSWMVVH